MKKQPSDTKEDTKENWNDSLLTTNIRISLESTFTKFQVTRQRSKLKRFGGYNDYLFAAKGAKLMTCVRW